jgi:arsenate reductase
MAEAWTRALHAGRIEAFSAGTDPHGVDPRAVQVMAEEGVDLSTHRSKHVSEYAGRNFDWVVTVCDRAKESCPVFPAATGTLHAGFDDPPALARDASPDEALAIYRRVRDEIRSFVTRLPSLLVKGP